jgi:hypothetical protein
MPGNVNNMSPIVTTRELPTPKPILKSSLGISPLPVSPIVGTSVNAVSELSEENLRRINEVALSGKDSMNRFFLLLALTFSRINSRFAEHQQQQQWI